MPFENSRPPRRKVAVIGAGITGLGAAWRLSEECDVTLYEAEPRLGGHARTIMAGKRGDQPVDTGFIVFNYANYPNLSRLFDEIDVPVVKSTMSFGASVRAGRLEYGLDGARAFFAQRRNAVSPRFLGMLRDIFRFNANAVDLARQEGNLTIGEFLDRMRVGPWFRDYYLLPLTGAIWSTPTEKILDFPAHAMIRFMENHALLNYSGQHQWYTVKNGSQEYVSRLAGLLESRGVALRPGTPVSAIRRTDIGAEVRAEGAEWVYFDEVILATHGDVSLRLLSDPSVQERQALGAVRYQANDMVLHADTSVMPKRRAVWSSWNYAEGPARRDGQIDITYWMNSLQPIPMDDLHFVTLNSNRPIREDLIYDQAVMHHPVYDKGMIAAQQSVRAFNGTDGTWFCGAWLRNGFHEDGLATGLEVAEAILARDRMPVAAE
ncbi:NAD(P)/FAD-dependent oxidoreductase [Roseovarius aestuariivivens]|uniref:NAD(P)/FAD-dependent oxidoreductase n=1 Tax=Roseovarius aestuariivivens TaxID=1888910 RepID=UPI0010808A1B|nr:FAD-dependent oxidoreductase [Roseovarius aestuariivivens]